MCVGQRPSEDLWLGGMLEGQVCDCGLGVGIQYRCTSISIDVGWVCKWDGGVLVGWRV